MNTVQLAVNLVGIGVIAWIVWYFWLYKKKGVAAAETNGVQETTIKVKGGYDPDVIIVKKDRPVRLL